MQVKPDARPKAWDRQIFFDLRTLPKFAANPPRLARDADQRPCAAPRPERPLIPRGRMMLHRRQRQPPRAPLLVCCLSPRGARRSNPAERRTWSRILVAPAHGLQSDSSRSRSPAFNVIPLRLVPSSRSLLQAAESLPKFATVACRLRLGRDLWSTRPTTYCRRSGGKTPARSSARSIAEAHLRSASCAASSRRSAGAGGAAGGRSMTSRGL